MLSNLVVPIQEDWVQQISGFHQCLESEWLHLRGINELRIESHLESEVCFKWNIKSK